MLSISTASLLTLINRKEPQLRLFFIAESLLFICARLISWPRFSSATESGVKEHSLVSEVEGLFLVLKPFFHRASVSHQWQSLTLDTLLQYRNHPEVQAKISP